MRGYLHALEDAQIPRDEELVQLGDFKEASGYEAMNALLNNVNDLTAVFVTSFQMTYGAMRAINERGLYYKKEIALMGFDITDSKSLMSSGITSVIQPERSIGMTAVNSLLSRIENHSDVNHNIILDYSIVERQST